MISIFSNRRSVYLISFFYLSPSLFAMEMSNDIFIPSYLFFFFLWVLLVFIIYASWLVISCIVLCMSSMHMLPSFSLPVHFLLSQSSFACFLFFLTFLFLWNIHLRSCFAKHNTHKLFKSRQKGNIRLFDKRGKTKFVIHRVNSSLFEEWLETKPALPPLFKEGECG